MMNSLNPATDAAKKDLSGTESWVLKY